MLTAILPAGTTWRTLIAYQKLVASKLDAGIERALGGAVLAQGGFEDHSIYEWYNEQVRESKENEEKMRKKGELKVT